MTLKAAPLRTALLWSSAQTAARMALSFLSIKVTAIYLGPAGLALNAQLGTLLSLLHGAIGTAIETGVVNLTAEHEKEKRLAPLWSTAMKLALTLSVIAGTVMILAARPLSNWLLTDPKYWPAMVIGGITLPFSLAGIVLTSALNGMKKIHLIGMIGTGSILVGSLIFIPLAFLFGLWGGLIGTALSTCSTYCVATGLILRSQSIKVEKFFGPSQKEIFSNLIAYYPMLLVHSIVEPATWLTVRNIITASAGLESAGHWQAAARLSDMLIVILKTAASMHLMAHLSSTKDANFGSELTAAVLKITALSALGAAGVYLLRDLVIALLFTEEFISVRTLLPYILVGDVLKMAALPLQMALVIKLRAKSYIINIIIMAVSVVSLTWLWMPQMGAEAASAAYAAASAAVLIFLVLVCKEYWHAAQRTPN